MIMHRRRPVDRAVETYPHNLVLEQSCDGLVAGIDEVGCGPWAGPVMAAAVILFPDKLPMELLQSINDSKKLTARKRRYLYELLYDQQGHGALWSVGSASVEEISQHNIRQAALLAMQRAVGGLSQQPDIALIDGMIAPTLRCKTMTVKRGDGLSLSIGAASILAKVERDQHMHRLAEEYPVYSWQTNVGYGTAAHQRALDDYGPTPHHRPTFKPIARLLEHC